MNRGGGSFDDRGSDLWARTYPQSFRIAVLLTGDPASAARIAERTFVRLHSHYRDARSSVGLEAWTLKTAVKLSHRACRWPWGYGKKWPDAMPGLEALGSLSFRKRAAFVLSTYEGLGVQDAADALDCSPGGFNSLLGAASVALDEFPSGPPTLERMSSLVDEVPEPAFDLIILSKAGVARAIFTVCVVLAIFASSFGVYRLLRIKPSEAATEKTQDVEVPGINDDDEDLQNLAKLGPPGWCPHTEGTVPIQGDSFDNVAEPAIILDIALSRPSGYARTISSLTYPSEGAPKDAREWPHHDSSGGLGVFQYSRGSLDPNLVRSCGEQVAHRTLKVAILQRTASATGELVVFYAMKVGTAWKIWGSVGSEGTRD